jgi:hypothetical protein
MSVASIDRLNSSVSVRPSGWQRLYATFMAWQDRRAQREIDRHAHLLVGHKAAFDRLAAGNPDRGAAATWNALLTGTTCEAGVRTIDRAPIDFSRL